MEAKDPRIQSQYPYVKGHKNVETNALSRLPMDLKATEVMLNHPPMDPQNPLLNKNPLDLQYLQSW